MGGVALPGACRAFGLPYPTLGNMEVQARLTQRWGVLSTPEPANGGVVAIVITRNAS